MKKLTVLTVILALGLIFAADYATANDVNVYDVTLQNLQGSGASTTVDVKFSVSQKNAFPSGLTDGNSAAYYDRVWIFVKYFNSTDWAADTAWKHATLVAGGTMSAYSGGTVGVGLAGNNASNASPYLGAFVKPGANQIVRWNIGAATDETSSINTAKTYKVRVFAIEMVLVPTGAFWVGSGGTESGSFTDGSWTSGATIPVKITSEDAITIGQSPGNLWGTSTSGNNSIGGAGTLPAAFPKGYNAFYIMKYEISQKQYCDFLNTLAREQQKNRIWTNIANNATSVTNIYVMANKPDTTLTYRTNIVCPATITANVPITFSTITPHRAANFLCWADLCAYADWAGLRPMTELEFEKACRGRKSATDTAAANVVANEWAWGNTNLYSAGAYTLSNDGTSQEAIASQPTGTGNCHNGDHSLSGPLRCGIFATSATSRQEAGASYYGVMELSGNEYERCVSVGEATKGRAFTGTHGDGLLTTTTNYEGNATNTDWPGIDTTPAKGVTTNDATGSGFRGGSWYVGSSSCYVSMRNNADWAYTIRGDTTYGQPGPGGRCVRTSP